MRIPYNTDIKTDAGFILTDVECELLIERMRPGGCWIVSGVYTLDGRSLLASDVTRIDREIAGAIVDRAEDELLQSRSKLLRRVEEAASFEMEDA